MIAVVVVGRLSGQGTRYRQGRRRRCLVVEKGHREAANESRGRGWQRGGTGSGLAMQATIAPDPLKPEKLASRRVMMAVTWYRAVPTRRSTAICPLATERSAEGVYGGCLCIYFQKSSQNSPLRASLRSKGSRSGRRKSNRGLCATRTVEQQGRVSESLLVLGKWEDEATSFP